MSWKRINKHQESRASRLVPDNTFTGPLGHPEAVRAYAIGTESSQEPEQCRGENNRTPLSNARCPCSGLRVTCRVVNPASFSLDGVITCYITQIIPPHQHRSRLLYGSYGNDDRIKRLSFPPETTCVLIMYSTSSSIQV